MTQILTHAAVPDRGAGMTVPAEQFYNAHLNPTDNVYLGSSCKPLTRW